jgi:hypothetical protein
MNENDVAIFRECQNSRDDLEGMPLPQVVLVRVAVSIVQFDQMYWVPISASGRSSTLVYWDSCQLDSNARPDTTAMRRVSKQEL